MTDPIESDERKTPLIVYHANCIDGMAAAWAAWRYFNGNCELWPAQYGSLIPGNATKRVVFIVDFSYPREALKLLSQLNSTVIVLDHHKTAAEDLAGFPAPPPIEVYDFIHQGNKTVGTDMFPEPVYAEFDMNRSGAGMTWDYFNPGKPRPVVISHIEDRDLWRFKQRNTRAIHACLASYPMGDFPAFNQLIWQAEGGGYETMIREGEAIDRRHNQMVVENIKACTRRMNIGGYDVPVCNAPYAFASDTGNILCKDEPFAATYTDTTVHRAFSLRSSETGQDVSEIAKAYGGGGHRNASGFVRPRNWEGDPT